MSEPVIRTVGLTKRFGTVEALHGGVDPGWVEVLLGRFDLDPPRRVGELSTGNRRKVGIVQAVIHRPELLVLDEPSSGLDPLLQYEFQQLVRELADTGTTVFLSSHVLPEVEALAGRVAILRRGGAGHRGQGGAAAPAGPPTDRAAAGLSGRPRTLCRCPRRGRGPG